MDKKRAASDLSDVPEKRRFRVDTLDLFLTGEISGQRAKKHLEHAQRAGAEHVDDLAPSSGASSSNAHRDLLRKALKDNLWPSHRLQPQDRSRRADDCCNVFAS